MTKQKKSFQIGSVICYAAVSYEHSAKYLIVAGPDYSFRSEQLSWTIKSLSNAVWTSYFIIADQVHEAEWQVIV